MKRPLCLLMLVMTLTSTVVGEVSRPDGSNPLTWRLDTIIDGAAAIRADNRQLEDGIADANRKVLKVDDAWRKAFEKREAEHAAEVKELQRQLRKFDHWYVRAVIIAAAWIRGIAIAYAVLCGIAIVTSFLNPATAAFSFGRFLFNNLPIMGWTNLLSSRRVLPAK